jgi:RIO-like serine/threonine protein kinase
MTCYKHSVESATGNLHSAYNIGMQIGEGKYATVFEAYDRHRD